MNAIHATINVLDALTTSYFGKRASGAHTDVLSLLKGIFNASEYQDVQKQFTSLRNLKNASEYQPDLMGNEEAEKAVKWAERIIGKAKEKLKGLE
ncbi:hypothetical protein Ngar_c31550 [Candidatus Nitrososphaera gargensis Ga9.2]|uniref:HEPN domain-containing protein n=1 Tax=Nitrososphaera gargensis (strain Ga9.2) TaxID=1237085 RepID=K0IFC5_NITGG|nr:hypothetical protein Ngar_c31550 [Candidatus Nitrososphaera gargensis Ga9.2]